MKVKSVSWILSKAANSCEAQSYSSMTAVITAVICGGFSAFLIVEVHSQSNMKMFSSICFSVQDSCSPIPQFQATMQLKSRVCAVNFHRVAGHMSFTLKKKLKKIVHPIVSVWLKIEKIALCSLLFKVARIQQPSLQVTVK